MRQLTADKFIVYQCIIGVNEIKTTGLLGGNPVAQFQNLIRVVLFDVKKKRPPEGRYYGRSHHIVQYKFTINSTYIGVKE